MKRNICSCNRKVKEKCYNTFVRPSLEYSSSVWDPFCKNKIDHLEKVQRRAARFVSNDYSQKSSVRAMLRDLEWTPLEERRAKNKMNFFYKAREGNICIPLNHLHLKTRSNRKDNIQYHIPSSRINTHLNSFYPNVIRRWNDLPADIQTSQSATVFDNKIKNATLRCSYHDWYYWAFLQHKAHNQATLL